MKWWLQSKLQWAHILNIPNQSSPCHAPSSRNKTHKEYLQQSFYIKFWIFIINVYKNVFEHCAIEFHHEFCYSDGWNTGFLVLTHENF